MPSIVTALAESATKYAHRAVASYIVNELPDFYLSAGIAIEQAMKQRLARENPAYIAPDKGFKHAVALCHAKDDIDALPPGTKTVGAAEAMARVTELEPAFKRHNVAVQEVLAFRNGEAHLGASGSANHRQILASFLKAVNELLRIPPDDFWAEHAPFVTATLDETMAAISREVAEKIAAAKLAYRRKFESMPEDQKTAMLAYVEQERDRHTGDDAKELDCPACGSAALLSGENRLEYDVDVDHREGTIIGGGPYLEFSGNLVECAACGLELDGLDEIQAAGIDAVFVNDDADISDYMDAEWEGD